MRSNRNSPAERSQRHPRLWSLNGMFRRARKNWSKRSAIAWFRSVVCLLNKFLRRTRLSTEKWTRMKAKRMMTVEGFRVKILSFPARITETPVTPRWTSMAPARRATILLKIHLFLLLLFRTNRTLRSLCWSKSNPSVRQPMSPNPFPFCPRCERRPSRVRWRMAPLPARTTPCFTVQRRRCW